VLPEESARLKALQDIFRQLNSTSLPVSPVALTNSFGWNDQEPNEPRDIRDFWREFTGTSHDWLGAASESAFAGLFRGSTITRTILDWGSSKITRKAYIEDFWGMCFVYPPCFGFIIRLLTWKFLRSRYPF
jgi:hypothetical protein